MSSAQRRSARASSRGSPVRPRRRDDLRGRVPWRLERSSPGRAGRRAPRRLEAGPQATWPATPRPPRRASCGASGRKRADRGRRLVQLAAQQVDRVRRLEREPPRRASGTGSRRTSRRRSRAWRPRPRPAPGTCTRPFRSACRPRSACPLRDMRAMPKSETFARPSSSKRMLAGFRSRWMSPCSCACASPAATSAAIVPRLGVRQRAALAETLLERAARQVLEDHERPPALASVVVETADVRMRQRGDGPRLALEALRIGVGAEELERDRTSELRVGCEPDLGHRPGAQLLLQPIAAGDRLAHVGSSLWAPWPRPEI